MRRLHVASKRRGGTSPSHHGIRVTTRSLVLMAIGVTASVTLPARADTASCVEAHSSGQREMKARNYLRASELFTRCGAAATCPDAIREECVAFYATVERNIPTVIFAATDENGEDLTNVKVYSGERLLNDGLDGRSVALDIGSHRFAFLFPDGYVRTVDVLVREGEKNRIVSVQAIARQGSPAAAPSNASPRETAPASTSSSPAGRGLPAGFWLATGVGAAALVSTGVFALLGHEQQTKIDACSPACGASDRAAFDEMRRDYLVADISLGVAVVSAGFATWLFISHRSGATDGDRGARGSRRRVAVLPSVSTTGAAVVLSTEAF